MASPSFAAAATSPASSPLTLDPIPLASRPPASAATAGAPRKRPVLLLDHRPHPASPNPPISSAAAAAAAGSAPQARRKKPHSSSSRPRWQTVLSVAAKNAVLIAVLLYLGDLTWRWSHPAPPQPADRAALEGYEARVAEVEASLARSFRMLQLQLEAIDRKIDGEVGAAKGELVALLEEKRLALEGELDRLSAWAGELGDALAGPKRMEFLERDEFLKFWEEVKGSLGSESRSEVDLDQVRAVAREIVMKEIEKHAADGIGRVDYAVGSAGGRVVRHSDVYDARRASFMSALRGGDKIDPQKMLQPSFGEPGQCFALQGSNGFVEIKLKTAIIPEAVTLEHVSKDVAYDRSTAPKDCRLSGWYEETPGEARSSDAAKMSVLAAFTYDLEKNNVQTFGITAQDVGVINMVRLDFTSNHGSSLLTCIYRLRVHGHEPISPTSIGSQA